MLGVVVAVLAEGLTRWHAWSRPPAGSNWYEPSPSLAAAGDQLVVTKLDRLGRSLEHLIDLSNDLHTRSVDLIVLDQGIDPTAVSRMFLPILGSVGVRTRPYVLSERTRNGLAAALVRRCTGDQKPRRPGRSPVPGTTTQRVVAQRHR